MEQRTPESLLEQGCNAKSERRPEDARNAYREALSECHSEDGPLVATIYEELAYVERNLDDLVAAEQHYRKASEIYRGLDRPLKVAHTIRHAADILREQSKRDESALLYAESLEIYRNDQKTPPLDLANAIRGFALLKEDQDDREQAVCLWQEAGKLYELTGIEAGVAESRRRIGLLTGE
ncbi:MAG TPA: tetratricopeptide repeat protein [Terracidiphilus sp.]|nr:tetratricopeptide repeat protein [Terracidiphilus sp.]